MADPRFFTNAGPFSLGRLAEISGADLAPGADASAMIRDVAPLDTAGEGEISFLDNKLYLPAFERSRAAVCIVQPDFAKRAPEGMALLLSGEPYRAYARVAQAFYPEARPAGAIHPRAVVDPTAQVGEGTDVDAGAVIEAGAIVGRHCRISANAVIGRGVVVGDDCYIGPNATLTHCLVGSAVRIHAGACVGQDGFGFAMGPQGHLKVPQLGRVVIHDDVEIGACATIDRGAGPDTVIESGCRIDNLVQIGHNVHLGKGCVLVAQVGISGSTKLGDFVIVGGQAGLTGHLKIGSGARIAAQSGVMRDLSPGVTVGGSPAMPVRDWHRQTVALARLVKQKGE